MADFLSSLKPVVRGVSPLFCGAGGDDLDGFIGFWVVVSWVTGRLRTSGRRRVGGAGMGAAGTALISFFSGLGVMILGWVSSSIMVPGPGPITIMTIFIPMMMMISVSRFRKVTFCDGICGKTVFCRMSFCKVISFIIISNETFFRVWVIIFVWN